MQEDPLIACSASVRRVSSY